MIKKYTADCTYSYIEGVFGIVELVKRRYSDVTKIFITSKLNAEATQLIKSIIKDQSLLEVNDRQVEKLASKDNIYAIAVFRKYQASFTTGNQLVLVNIMDSGNLGTIIRTALGFGVINIAIISPAVDYFHPKVLRASMGAFFSVNITTYDSFADYQKNNKLMMYPFMLDAKQELKTLKPQLPYALIFGNESSGLDSSYLKVGTPIFIEHSKKIDSLNLANAVAIALYQLNDKK